MANKILDTRKLFKMAMIFYAAILVIGIVMTVAFGVKLDINFSGGTRLSYTYEGKVSLSDVEKTVKEVVDRDFTVSENESIAGDTKTITISFAGNESLSTDSQISILDKLQETYKDNKFEEGQINAVAPTVAGAFLKKSLAAVALTAILVVIYVGIRFRKIGGVSAALTALCALVLDIMVSFFVCVIFRLQLDSNYIAVVLTILGYSLNDTIVIYDRVRENRKYHPELETRELVDLSISTVKTRNIVTTVTTISAVFVIILVAELFGLTTLRTFAIPMAFGLVSGCISSLFVSGPLWVFWREYRAKKEKK
ncbi:MAG: protein translocase subunit SecF [Ruminococcaceae bacterium]|nr:protein translocase subunit SecF [Oscillospiraceae bacterium]